MNNQENFNINNNNQENRVLIKIQIKLIIQKQMTQH